MKTFRKTLRFILKTVKRLLFIAIAAAVIYAAYVLISFQRAGSGSLEINVPENAPEEIAALPTGTKMSAITYNIGFGAYNKEFSFFLDGGENARAESKDAVYENLAGITGYLSYRSKADVMLLQEVDEKGTRSYGVNEVETILKTQQDKWSTFALNYDSPYLLYPFKEPIGKNKSGLLTLTSFPLQSADRVRLPVEDFPNNLFDLDRCYSKQYTPTANGNSLVVYNAHLSAYSEDGEITDIQLRELFSDMQYEYDSGNYVLLGGDFNRDLLGDSSEVFGRDGKDVSWAQSFPVDSLSVNFTLCAPSNAPTCRDTAEAYDPEETFVLSIDGFIVSDNIEVMSCKTENLHFAYSDHNPVRLEFKLK